LVEAAAVQVVVLRVVVRPMVVVQKILLAQQTRVAVAVVQITLLAQVPVVQALLFCLIRHGLQLPLVQA
jgi:hypothetical protein